MGITTHSRTPPSIMKRNSQMNANLYILWDTLKEPWTQLNCNADGKH